MNSLACHSIHILLGYTVHLYHMPTHATHRGELLVAYLATRIAGVHLHMIGQAAALKVSCSTDMAGDRTICGREENEEE